MEKNIVGTYVSETLDWSAEHLTNAVNEQQQKSNKKLLLTGTDFEHSGTEFQVILFSKTSLTDKDVKKEIEKIKAGF